MEFQLACSFVLSSASNVHRMPGRAVLYKPSHPRLSIPRLGLLKWNNCGAASSQNSPHSLRFGGGSLATLRGPPGTRLKPRCPLHFPKHLTQCLSQIAAQLCAYYQSQTVCIATNFFPDLVRVISKHVSITVMVGKRYLILKISYLTLFYLLLTSVRNLHTCRC